MSAIDDIAAYLASLETGGKNIDQIIFDELTPVVRCGDCRYYKPNTYSHFTCELLMFHAQPNDFCCWGEREDA